MSQCILKRADYIELTEQAGAAASKTADKIIELLACLRVGLNQDQRGLLAEIEELTQLETAQAQDGLVRLLCGCQECRG